LTEGSDSRPVRRGVVAALAVTTTIGYGVLYYAFAPILDPMADELRISTTAAAGALTLAILVTATMSIPVGRWLDARGGHGLMTVGAVLGAAAVLAWSQVQNVVQLYGAFVLIGLASAMLLYAPAFAVVVAITAPERRANALLSITLVGGLASTIFIPLTGQLIEALAWRNALLVLAAIVAGLSVPLHAIALRRTRAARTERQRRTSSPSRVLSDAGFWLLVVAFVLQNAGQSVMAVYLVSYLIRLGHAATLAATLAGLLGLLSVTGRVLTTVAMKRWSIASITAGVFAVQGVATALLPVAGRSVAGAAACIVLFGFGFGIAAIAIPAILVDRYGATGYGTISGTLGTPVSISRALAPLGGALLAAALGYHTLVLIAGLATIASGFSIACLRWLPTKD
jgi:predicted MFS family arabinose efflux permease